jgi:hypothetical protein
MLSRKVDGPARMAYAHKPVRRRRHFIIIGTTNLSRYLSDATGGRRFWPVTVKQFDLKRIRADRDQLWAEAVVHVKKGASIRLPRDLWEAASIEQERRRTVDPWEDTLRTTVLAKATHVVDDTKVLRIAGDDLYNAVNLPSERRDRDAGVRISTIMQRFGFVGCTVRAPKPGGKKGETETARGYKSESTAGDVIARLTLTPEDDDEIEREPGDDDVPF